MRRRAFIVAGVAVATVAIAVVVIATRGSASSAAPSSAKTNGGSAGARPKPSASRDRCRAEADCFPKPPGRAAGATGLPPKTKLRRCGASDTISAEATVIDGCLYTGSLTIGARRVTIRNSRIMGSIRGVEGDAGASFTVVDSEIGPDSGCGTFEALIGYQRYTARRNYLHNNGDGFRAAGDHITVEDNFVTLCSNPGDHSDGIQGFGAGQDILIRHNTFDQRPAKSVTAPVFFADNSESATISDNLLLAPGPSVYALRVNDDHTPDIGPWVVTGNRLVGTSAAIDTECRAASMSWSDNRRVTVDRDYEITSTGKKVNCG